LIKIRNCQKKEALTLFCVLLMLLISPDIQGVEDGCRTMNNSLGRWDIRFGMKGGIIYHNYDDVQNIAVKLPDYLKARRKYSDLALKYRKLQDETLTDNPLLHAATFNELSIRARNRGFMINARAILEHRGFSCGVYNTENSIVYPKFTIAADSSFNLYGEEFHFGLSLGNYDNIKEGEGLTLYNIDLQGIRTYLRWGRIQLRVDMFGDLSGTYDLDIDDLGVYSLSLRDTELSEQLSLDIETGIYLFEPVSDTETTEKAISLSLVLRGGSLRIYSETGLGRVDGAYFDSIDQSANVTGVEYLFNKDPFDFDITAERRFYGRSFNLGFRSEDNSFNFRDNNKDISHNSIGQHLYPMSHFLRPFSQWAVYTEYQKRDVASYILQGRFRYSLPAGFFFSSMVDLNYMDVSNEDPFLYPFYNIGVGWCPIESSRLSISLTNRAMNLDEQYPTLYLLESPTTEYSWYYQLHF